MYSCIGQNVFLHRADDLSGRSPFFIYEMDSGVAGIIKYPSLHGEEKKQ
jgi:hypothetical protein